MIRITTSTTTMDRSSNIQAVEIQDEVSNSFLQYALSIILGRAIPDVRDGLKPVHRRILYAMDQLSLVPTSAHRKCARVVGEVLGKYHPHGDVAVYDALVRMAQDFSTHHPLIDGHGNFGSIDADPAAAMRYTECRLTPLAKYALLSDEYDSAVSATTSDDGIGIVQFVRNFDGNEIEPTVLPAKIPLLLLNGASGIAVGMATNVPPHNLNELMNACTAIVAQRKVQATITDDELFQWIPGPDFPTGASIVGIHGAQQLYKTGHGGVTMRAISHVENDSSSTSNDIGIINTSRKKKGSTNSSGTRRGTSNAAIIVTELPYQVNKAALLEKIATLVNERKLEGISDLRDESDRDGIRIVIELKRDAVAAVVLNNLYQKTQLQTTFSGNFLALMMNSNKQKRNEENDNTSKSTGDNNEKDTLVTVNNESNVVVPQRFTLRRALDSFLDFRFETIRRKSQFQLSKVRARVHIVQGLLIALTDADAVIELIRSASDQASARIVLQERLGTSPQQTDAILKLQLGQLTRLNKGKLQNEKNDLENKDKELSELMHVDNAVYDYMLKEFDEVKTKFGRDRKTIIIPHEDSEVSELDLVRNSRSVIVVTRGGYIKRLPLKTFEMQGRGTRGKRGITTSSFSSTDSSSSSSQTSSRAKSDEEVAHCFSCNDHDTLLMVTQTGIAYGIRAYQIPSAGRTARGQPIPSVLPAIASTGIITTILPVSNFDDSDYLILATEKGWIKKTPLSAFENMSSRGLVAASLDDGDRLRWCQQARDGDDILIGTSNGMASRFKVNDLRPTRRTSRGVRARKLKEGDTIADVNVLIGAGREGSESLKDGMHHQSLIPTKYALVVTANGFGKRVPTSEFRTTARGGVGVISIKFKASSGPDEKVSCLLAVNETDEILVITAKGIMLRQKVFDIPSQSRSATGVVIQKLDDGDRIVSVSIVPTYEETD